MVTSNVLHCHEIGKLKIRLEILTQEYNYILQYKVDVFVKEIGTFVLHILGGGLCNIPQI